MEGMSNAASIPLDTNSSCLLSPQRLPLAYKEKPTPLSQCVNTHSRGLMALLNLTYHFSIRQAGFFCKMLFIGCSLSLSFFSIF